MATSSIEKPQRWDDAFDPEMNQESVDRLLGISPFREMDASKFSPRTPLRGILENDTRIRAFNKGEIITRQGDYGTSAFLILSGAARVVLKPDLPPSTLGRQSSGKKGIFKTLAQMWNFKRPPEFLSLRQLRKSGDVESREGEDAEETRVFLQDVPRVLNEHRTESMGAGEFFGEIAALSRMPRTSTIFADTDQVELLEIRWQGLRDLMKNDSALRSHIDRIYRERALASYLRSTRLFQHLDKAQLEKVAAGVEFFTYGEYDWSGTYKSLAKSGAVTPEREPSIIAQGDYPNGIVLVRAGFVRVSQKYGTGERTLNYLGAGEIFGLEEIAHNWRNTTSTVNYQFSLRAIGYTHVLFIPTKVLEDLVLPTLPAKWMPASIPVRTELEAFSDPGHGRSQVDANTLEFLTENRFFNGTAAMVIDLDRCTRCDDCVRACASSHDNNPRFLRHGPVSGNFMVANACMHCADPVCMIGCPTGAIHRESFAGQVVINPSTCIGCKACYNNCPYEAIRMVEVRDAGGEIMVDQQMQPIAKATKCDLCVENHGGPACQRACPHGALVRMNLNHLETLYDWLKR